MKKYAILIFFLFCNFFLFAQVYKTNVTVSYYAEAFHGKKTSNGERFNMNAFTCAHKTLPFNTILKVTNLSNGKSVQVRINDRGPFVVGREVDLSKAAAIQIGMIGTGTCRARIEIVQLGKNTKLSQQTAASAVKMMAKKGEKISTSIPSVEKKVYASGTYWDFQIGAYSTKEAANKVAQKLLKQGFKDVVFQKTETVVRVVIRKVPAANVSEMQNKLDKAGYSGYIIRERKE